MKHEDDSGNEHSLSRRLFLKTSIAVAGSIAVGKTLHTAGEIGVGSPMRKYERKGTGKGVLTVPIPGFIASDVRQQTSPFHQVYDQYGDTLMIQATGGLYDEKKMAEFAAEMIADKLKRRKYGWLILNGVSMGGNVANDALLLLHGNGTLEDASTEADAIMFDTPASQYDLPVKFQAGSPLLDVLPSGAIANLLPKMNGMDESLVLSQAEALTSRKAPAPGSLAFLRLLTYWESLQGGDMVQADKAIANWKMAVGEDRFRHYPVDIPHVAFEAYPTMSRAALEAMYRDTLAP